MKFLYHGRFVIYGVMLVLDLCTVLLWNATYSIGLLIFCHGYHNMYNNKTQYHALLYCYNNYVLSFIT